ncbi:hypothetical protein JVT61DRAFT_12616 [Boletus reticuloceps]|uniref:Uncharacterized protein n=1 Tax=Boletus reticuloceps TaxID=495285 RepID=A0A8I3A4N3_9AGAM|nr:hypothetical protein JVT61DRAFT_12616 [Boletus reticuloceps]
MEEMCKTSLMERFQTYFIFVNQDRIAYIGHFFDRGRENERQRIMHLTLEQFRNLHRHFRHAWSDWVNNAPQEWKEDGFLVNNTPVAITLHYGQNQMLRQRLDDDSMNQERHNWELDHDYTNILTFTFSLASHVTFSHVTGWRNVPPEEIVARYGRLFTAPPGDRNRTEIDDLANFPFMQDAGSNVVPIYTKEGYVVFRREPRPGHSDLGGALLNLSLTPQLFLPPNDEEDFVIRAAPCSLYPLAFSKTLGNMQASDGLIYSFKEPLKMINEPLQAHLEDEDDSQDDGDSLFEEDDHPDRHRRVGAPVLRGLRCQGYNTLSHRVRNQSKFHAVQLGKITSAVSGTTAVGFASIGQWTRRVQECRNNLPHEAFHLKVHGENQPQAMRMENTYQLDVSRMKAEDRNGRAIYDNVITPLLRSWTYATVRESLKQVLVPFKRDIIPQMFEWVTFPVTSFLKLAWSKLEPTLDKDAIIEPYLIEMISMFERALNYGHTGAARVLTRTLMDRTWLSLGLIFDGFPSLSGRFISHGDLAEKSIKLYARHWPMDMQTNRPKTSSRRAQELTYGNDHYEAYIARFQIVHATKNLPDDVYTDMDHPCERLACYAAEIGMRVYIADITTFVEREISREIAPALRSDDLIEQTRATPRKRALDRWVDYEFPLSYSEATVTDLMRAVSDHREDDLRIVGADIGKQSLSFFVEKVIAACKPEVPRRQPPFIQQGRALSVIKMVISHITMTAKTARILSDADVESLIVNAFLRASRKLKINHVPWVANRVGQVGNPGTLINHTVWLSLGAADPPRAVDCAAFRTPEENTSTLIRQSSQRLIAGDPTGEWSAIKVRLYGFHTILHKTVLPVECTMNNVVISSGSPSYVGAMYGWVLSNFNVSKPIHFLALFCSVAFAGLLPSVHSPPDRSLPANTRTVAERNSYMKNLDWIEKNKKGATEAPPFILMFITYVLGFYERHSPVGRLVNDPKGDSRKWLEKNSEFSALSRPFGLADPVTGLALRSGKWNRDVTPLSEEELARKCAKVKDHLTSKSEYGAFDAVEYLAGTKTAQLLARNLYLKARPYVQLYGATENSGNQNKRASNAWQAEEPSTSYAEASGSRTNKRHRLS